MNKRSVSNEAEKSMIGKLKIQCGAPFTSKLEGMVTDQLLCEERSKEFSEFQTSSGQRCGTIDFSVQVLTTGFWPTYKMMDVVLSPLMNTCIATFTEWYNTKTQHRQLKWIHAIGEATVHSIFGTRKGCDMVVGTLQAVTLMAFNDVGDRQLTLAEVKEALNLDLEVVKRLLHSLSCGKYRVLTKSPMSRTIKAEDKFSVNAKFNCKQFRFRIPMASLEESHNPKRVEEDRSFAIDAAVVRIMKARKVLAHVQLIQEVLTQLHFFRPEPKQIKKRIEQLIEREYLERDPDNSRQYRYMA